MTRNIVTVNQFDTLGYIGPVSVLSEVQRKRLLTGLKRQDFPLMPDWPKALAVHSPEVYRIATQPVIIERVKGILGHDIMLWGASFVQRMPGRTHPWHNDIESSVQTGRTVSVWIGLKKHLVRYRPATHQPVTLVPRIRPGSTAYEWRNQRGGYCGGSAVLGKGTRPGVRAGYSKSP